MKPIKLLIPFLTLIVMNAGATSFVEKLVDVNQQWAYQPNTLSAVADYNCSYTDEEVIQKHLLLVHGILSEREVQNLNSIQTLNRRQSLDQLLQYAQRGIFPKNITHSGRRPVFIDHRGVHCAVGYLIMRSGHAELSKHISRNMNYEYLLNMQDDALTAWVRQSGFSSKELAWIQPGYLYPVDYQPLKGGVDGPVGVIIGDNMSGIFAGGSFDSADAKPTGNLAQWFAGFAGYDWSPVGNSNIDGEINDMIYYHNELYVAGNFDMAGSASTTSGVVKWDGVQWTAVGSFYIGALENYVIDLEIYRDTLFAGGFFRSEVGAPELVRSLAKWDGTQWRNTGIELTGTVNALHVHQNKLVIGGDFIVNNAAQTKNIIMLNGDQPELFAEDIKVKVNDLETYKGELFVATDYMNQAETDTLGLAVYRNNSWELLFSPFLYTDPGSIKALAASNDALIFGGDFVYSQMMGSYGNNIAFYRNNMTHALGSLGSTVRSLYVENDLLYAGGDFTSGITSSGITEYGHIVKVYLPDYIGLKDLKLSSNSIYPIPASDYIFIENEGSSNFETVILTDMKGIAHPVSIKHEDGGISLDLKDLPRGMYFLQASSKDAVLERKVVLE